MLGVFPRGSHVTNLLHYLSFNNSRHFLAQTILEPDYNSLSLSLYLGLFVSFVFSKKVSLF